jgi:putative DNA primase/helicase
MIEHDFKTAALTSGIAFTGSIITDGKLHRCHIEGQRPGTKNGAYILHIDRNPCGWGMDYTSGTTFKWSANGKRQTMTPAMRDEIEAESRRRQREQKERHSNAAEKASEIWKRAIYADAGNPYLHHKRIQPHRVKTGDSGALRGVLIVPIVNSLMQLVNLQFIAPDGTKRFLSGGKKQGCFSVIGKLREATNILVCEGWATGASLNEATGLCVIVALDAGNLIHVAKNIKAIKPDAEVVICGDNDLSGVGQKAARQAALVIGARYIIPSTPGHDWNDSINAGSSL